MTLRVAVLHQGRPGAADPIRASAWAARGQICRALATLGHAPLPVFLDADLAWADHLLRARPDLVFNAADLGFFYDIALEPHVAGVLESTGLPYTGSPASAGLLAIDKYVSKLLLRAAGVRVPRFALASDPAHDVGFPLIVKPRRGANSVGLTAASVVERPEDLEPQLLALGAPREEIILEQFVDGPEATAGFLGNAPRRLLPSFVIPFDVPGGPRFLDYRSKWVEDSDEYRGTIPVRAQFPPALQAELDAAMLATAELTGMRDYGRCDFRVGVGPDGAPAAYLLDVNTNCDVSDGAGLSRMAAAAGLSYPALVGAIVDTALARYTRAPARRPARGAPRRVAMLPRGLDGLFLPALPDVEVYALAEAGTPDEAWSRALHGDRTLPYTRTGGDPGPYPATGELLHTSTIGAALANAGVRELLLSSACTPEIRTWAHQAGVSLLATDDGDRRGLEDKIRFDALLGRLGLPRPRGGPARVRRRMPIDAPAVIQLPRSLGGEGTFFVRGPADVDALVQRARVALGDRVLVREQVAGAPYGITVFVAPGRVVLSAVRRQCYDAPPGGDGPLAFAGVGWVPSSALSPGLAARLGDVFGRLGEALHARRFFGFANVDFMVGEDDAVHLLECNPRMSAATPQLLRHPELTGGVPVGELFVRGSAGPLRFPARADVHPLPASSFAGAALDVTVPLETPPGAVRRAHPSGRYRLDGAGLRHLGPEVHVADDELAVVAYARAGQPVLGGDTLATVLAAAPLFAPDGSLTLAGARIRAALGHT